MVAPVLAEKRTPSESAVAPSATTHTIRPVMDQETQRIFLERVALNRQGDKGDIIAGQ
jgi:hypothetical protein